MRIRKLSRLKPVDLGLSPIEVARRLAHLDGFVFLDSSLPSDHALSIIGARPTEKLRGTLPDFAALEAAIATRTEAGPVDVGMPDGAAIGSFDYEGAYRFGIYDELLVFSHRNEQWFSRGDLIEAMAEPFERTSGQIYFAPTMEKEQFIRAVERVQEYIAAGDIYQVCL